ncbi:hypothetical protein BG011_004408 [Mortierella polycephala]|uniref:Uncharacterized protein n=1 Tax=Mortierella polycephala TaxID=41804 RepID=A0A9P6QEX0_9FUNG|nr:hypothetical protein BG011_004408 [Mortierella polycephala]
MDADNHASNRYPLSQILALYRKATSTFLLRQLATAYSTSLKALELLTRTNQEYGLDSSDQLPTRHSYLVLKQKLWILNVIIFGAILSDRVANELLRRDHAAGSRKLFAGSENSPEILVKDLWKRLVADYKGLEGDVDGQVMVPLALLCINQKLYPLAQQIIGAYLATIPENMLIHLETAAGALAGMDTTVKDPLMIQYERIVELYVVHVLTKLQEWEYARNFLEYKSALSDSSKKMYGRVLDKLHQKSLRPKKTTARKHFSTIQDQVLSSSTTSTHTSSPTMSTPLSATSHTLSQSLDTQSSHGINSPLSTSMIIAHSKAATVSSNVHTKPLVSNPDGKASASNSAPLSTLQRKLWSLVQHYLELIRSANAGMGQSQLMVILGLIAFLGALSRNQTRASNAMKTVVAKIMQTVKMGTTVTSI